VFLLRASRTFGRVRISAALLGLGLPFVVSGTKPLPSSSSQPPIRIPSYVAWTEETISAASNGDTVRGLVLARRCIRCHGQEGFSNDAQVPNLAGIDKLTMWKQLNDFRAGKRESEIMSPVATALEIQDYADLAAYYSMLPTYPDPQDVRSFPQSVPGGTHTSLAARLIFGGDGARGIPPCQVCHGPISYKNGAPSLITQNSDYIQGELKAFASGNRSNDIDMPMRTIARLMTDDEKQAVAAYYGAGLGNLPVGAFAPAK
jgi:cytochrome c553